MKKILILMLAFMPLFVLSQTKEEDIDPIPLVVSAVVHNTPIEPIKNVRFFLLSLTDPSFANGFNERVFEEAKKSGVSIKPIHRGNFITYEISQDSSRLKIMYYLYLKPEQGKGIGEAIYLDAKGRQYMSTWLNPYGEIVLDGKDDISDIRKYSNFIADIIYLDSWAPHRVTSRLTFNFAEYRDLFSEFVKIMDDRGLSVDYGSSNLDCFIYKKTPKKIERKYSVRIARVFQRTFEVSPKWRS